MSILVINLQLCIQFYMREKANVIVFSRKLQQILVKLKSTDQTKTIISPVHRLRRAAVPFVRDKVYIGMQFRGL